MLDSLFAISSVLVSAQSIHDFVTYSRYRNCSLLPMPSQPGQASSLTTVFSHSDASSSPTSVSQA